MEHHNPWILAWECSRGKRDLVGIGETIKNYLLEPIDSEKYLFAVEFLRSFKADASIDKVIDLTEYIFDKQIINKVTQDVSPDNILRFYKEKTYLSMDLLTLWEYLIIAGVKDIIGVYAMDLIDKIWNNINNDYMSVKDLVEALFYGPLSMLPIDSLISLISSMERYPCEKDCILFKSRLLNIIINTYSPKDTIHNTKFINVITQYIDYIINYTTKNIITDQDTILATVNELNILLEKLRFYCSELRDQKPCKQIIDNREEKIHSLFKKVMETLIH